MVGFSYSGFGSEGSGFLSGSIPIPFLGSLLGGGGGDDQPVAVRHKAPIWWIAAIASDLTPDQESAGNPGRPLTPCEKDCLKPYLDQVDLNDARVHTNGLAWYTTPAWWVDGTTPPGGHDIFIRAGKYDGSPEALALLGHELKHVEQWRKDPTVGIWGYLFHVNKYEGPANILQQQISLHFIKEHFGGCK
jgi:hypothetical protein